MADESLAKVKEIFLQACQLDGDSRHEFVDQACGGDEALRQEVLSLLEYHVADTVTGGLSDTGLIGRSDSVLENDDQADKENWVGRSLGKYRVTRVMDSGGMGIVLEARDDDIGRRVAIKVLHEYFSQDESVRQRFLAEARAAGNLHHANVITIHEVASQEERPYIVMEFASGGSVADRLSQDKAYPLDTALGLAIQACQGLAAAHRAGLVHRDVKPANLLLMGDGALRVSDFGVAKAIAAQNLQLTRQGQIVGTPHYMSPEQCEGAEVDARSDVYSMGATLYSLLVGTTPFADCKSLVSVIHSHCYAPPPDPRDKDHRIPESCARIIVKAMAKSPDDRYQSMDELRAALVAERGSSTTYQAWAPTPSVSPRPAPRRKVLMVLGGGIATAALAGLWYSRSSDHSAGGTTSGSAAPKGRMLPGIAAGAPLKVGVLHSLTGTMSSSERGIVDACQLAIDEVNASGGVLGHPIERVLRNGRSNDAVFAREAQSLITQEKVLTIFGCCTSSSRKAVKQVVEQHNHLLVYSVNHEGLEVSPNIIYLGCDPTQTVIPSVRWAVVYKRMNRFYLVGSDYVYPRAVNAMLKDEIASIGAEVVGESYLPLGETDVRPVVDEVSAVKPDAIINTISGDSQIAFLRNLRQGGVNAMQVSTGVGEEELRAVDPSRLQNDYAVATYFQSLDTASNRAFLGRFHAKFGESRAVNSAMQTAYSGVKMWARAVERAGQVTPTAIRDAMLHQDYQAPGGRIRLDPATHYAYRECMIGKVRPDGQFDIVLRQPSPVQPEPFPASRTREQWEAFLADLQQEWGGAWAAPIQVAQ